MKKVKSINALGTKTILVTILATLCMFVLGYLAGKGLYLLFN